jgi:hypothetical protein
MNIKLPPLPEAWSPEWPFSAGDELVIRNYGLAVAQAVREACAQECYSQRVSIGMFGGINYHVGATKAQCAEAIRAMKIEGETR